MSVKRFLAILAAWVSLGAGGFAQAGPKGPLAVGVLSDLDSVPILIADMRGFFKDAGLEVRLERFPSAMNRDAALNSGALDLAVSDLLAASFALDSGMGARVTQATQGAYRLMSAPGSRIASISGLKGKRIGISKNTIIEYALDRMLAAAGMQPGDIVKEVIPQMPLRLEALKAGKIDAAVLPEPLASAAALEGSRLIDSSERLGINPGVIIATPAAAANKAPALAAFRAAYDKAVEYLASAPPAEYLDELILKAGFPPSVKSVIRLPAYLKAYEAPAAETTAVAAWLLERGLIKKPLSRADYLGR